MNDLKSKLKSTLKNAILTASDDSIDSFISVLEEYIDSKTVYVPSYDEVLYGDESDEFVEDYDESDQDYEQYMEARYGSWTD